MARASDRARTAVEILQSRGGAIEYLGALLVAADEAVFHAFAAGEEAAVAEASARAGLRHERIVESVAINAPTLIQALTGLLGASVSDREEVGR